MAAMTSSEPPVSAYQYTLCIPTAGKGTRMGGLCQSLNKALLPLPDGRAVISHIIDKFPKEKTKFVIALGYKGDQVRFYLEKQHPDIPFKFCLVENFDGPGSGPGLSLQACLQEMERQESFYFVACDTLVADPIPFELQHDWMGVSTVAKEDSARYCNFKTGVKKEFDDVVSTSSSAAALTSTARSNIKPAMWISSMYDKQPYTEYKTTEEEDTSYIGLSFFYNAEQYWEGLELKDVYTQNELQMTNGIRHLVSTCQKPVEAVKFEWTDVGGIDLYMDVVKDPDVLDKKLGFCPALVEILCKEEGAGEAK
ncbi:unnamed protein product [Amoebophrya sp. A120]|nr:unnamed protein product [Amoebophrya sp. A120]|eukprot:GSA120T00020385001.1